MSSGSWAGADFVPTDGPVSAPVHNRSLIRKTAWIPALPYPAALVAWHDSFADFEQWNDAFSRCFGALIERTSDICEQWQLDFLDELANFSGSDLITRRFQIERMSPLGIEAFACTLTRVKGMRPEDDRILASAVDRTADRRIEESLRRELVSDTLTALPNRIGFGEAVEQLIEGCCLPQDARVGVLIVDLMRFSRVNEALGTMAGDELILAVAARLRSGLDPQIHLARLGGNEFGICHVATNGITDIMALAERVRSLISSPIRLGALEIAINCAVGCSLAQVADADPDELIRQAQTAARLAKQTDKLEIYRPGELGAARQRFFIESKLRDALAKGGLHLEYQPIIELSTSSVIGFEALARWKDPEMGSISPNEFIPVAEDSGLVVQLGRWALNEAMQQLARWDLHRGNVVPVKMNVNLSPIQMARDDVIGTIKDALRLSGVDGGRLMVEVTESALVGDPDACRHLLDALKRSHISVAMDDFGTGYSNMASLQSLPIDLLKIDRSFVSDLLVDQDKLAIVRAILSLAKALGMQTTAEGIEDGDVAAKLGEMGCTYGQGYYFARPMPADQAYDFWSSHKNCAT